MLNYIGSQNTRGDRSGLPGIPARDLTAAELEALRDFQPLADLNALRVKIGDPPLTLEAFLLGTGLYAKPHGKENKVAAPSENKGSA